MEDKMKYNRVFLIVCDSLGIGNAKDANLYNDEGSNTLKHICNACNGLDLPNLEGLGLGSLGNFSGIHQLTSQLGYTLALNEISNGKDTMTGHWEMMGLKTEKPFITFTETGFPQEFIELFEEKTGRKCVGNKAASGTAILDEYGEHQIKTGDWIVYTSADSVLQICGNEETFDLEELYRCCEIAREITLKDEWKVGRVIARPYVGKKRGEFKRTSNRKDYALKPSGKTALDALKENGLSVIAVGKIHDIFDGEGITQTYHSDSSVHGMQQTADIMEHSEFEGLCFVNLVDFDAVWGHRRNPEGYAKEVEQFDEKLGELLELMGDEDLLMITADHGNDPTYQGTDHTREQVPLLLYAKDLKGAGTLNEADSFAAIGATIAENFNVRMPDGTIGESMLDQIQ